MPDATQLVAEGMGFHQAGDLPRAEHSYRQALTLDPGNADAWHLLGVVDLQCGRLSSAAASILRAIAIDAGQAAYHSNLAEVYRAGGNMVAAEAACRRALAIAPSSEAHNNLGLALLAQGQAREAVEQFRSSLALAPGKSPALNNLGEAYRVLGDLASAEACFWQLLAAEPTFAAGYLNLGNVLRVARRPDEAAAAYRQALTLVPDYAKAHSNLSAVYLDVRRLDDAWRHATRAVELAPELGEALQNLAALELEAGHLTRAWELATKAAERPGTGGDVHSLLGSALAAQGRAADALVEFERAAALPGTASSAMLDSNLLFGMQHVPGISPDRLLAAHLAWDARHGRPEAARPAVVRGAQRAIRVGLVSADLGAHPVGNFLASWVGHVSADDMELFYYSDRPVEDALTAELRRNAAGWCDARPLDDDALSARIRHDGIDILCDLAGHTRGNRLPTFARRPAPVQLTWMGYVGTTGLAAIDYLIADRWLVPEDAERFYSERIVRLPDGWLCYRPPVDAPPHGALPALGGSPLTLGSFNNSAKINDEVIQAWAAILKRLPDSRLMLKFRWFDDPGTRQYFHERFASHGIDCDRILLRGWTDQAQHLAAYADVDLALDTFPYGGGITTCEALWMGVPVVTLSGPTFAARQSLSHVSNLGLGELAAESVDDYVEKAVQWGTNLERLATIRSQLRERMRLSPLCDGPRFARQIVDLLCRMQNSEAAGQRS